MKSMQTKCNNNVNMPSKLKLCMKETPENILSHENRGRVIENFQTEASKEPFSENGKEDSRNHYCQTLWSGCQCQLCYSSRSISSYNQRSSSLPILEGKQPSIVNTVTDICNQTTINHMFQDNNRVVNENTNESWFKTWPERGNDKFVASNSSDSSLNICMQSDICSIVCPDNNYSDNQRVRIASEGAVYRYKEDKSKPNFDSQTNGNFKLDSPDIVPSIDCDINTRISFNEKQANEISSTSIPLNELLQSIPLAYSPLTKQLHIINQTDDNCRPSTCLDKELEAVLTEVNTFEAAETGPVIDSCKGPAKRIDTSIERTHTSSFSSVVSSLSDGSPSVNEEFRTNYIISDDETSLGESSSAGVDDCSNKTRRRGISSFFMRNVFSWKLSQESNCAGNSGWKLFNRGNCSKQQNESGEVVASSSALILHERPSHLPAKCPDEEQKHRQEYQQMVEAARKKEIKEVKQRKKQLQQQLKFEEQLASAARTWNSEILPKWDSVKNSRKTRDLWWQGLPPSVRGKVWKLAIGNDLNITPQLYEICVARARDRLKAVCEDVSDTGTCADNPDKEDSVELIQLDIARTFPYLCIFQKGGPYYEILHSLLGAYVCYRPDVGYVQGMSFIAAILILNLEAADAFICFANLLNQPCHMAFFRLNQAFMQAYYATYNDFFRENVPRLFVHFTECSLSADLYLLDWIYTIFAKAMPLDVACRVWDVFLRDGEEFLFKTALGVLHLNQEILLQLDFLHGAQFLTKLPDDMGADQLFRSIEAIRMTIGKQHFSDVLSGHLERYRHQS